MGKQVQFDDAAREALRRGVDKLAGAVRVTLGPRGRNVVIEKQGGTPTITNDGFTIATEIELADRFENMGAQLVREVAIKTGQVAGDGTTTATVLAQALVSNGLKAVASGHNPMALRRGIEKAVEAVSAELARVARAVDGRRDMERIASVSANHDLAIGEMVAEALERVGRQGVVTVEQGRGTNTTLDVVEGIRIEAGYLSPYFVTDPESMEAVLESPLVMVADQRFSLVQELVPALEMAAEQSRPLLIVGEDVEAEALAMLVVNRLRGTAQSVAVKAPGVGDRRRELLEDLALLTGAGMMSPEAGRTPGGVKLVDLGRASRARVDHGHTTIVEGGGDPGLVRSAIARLESQVDSARTTSERSRLKERLGRLTGGVAVIRVGAHTEVEMKERTARMEDALASTRAALEEGIIPGGGVALLRAAAVIDKLTLRGEEKVGARIVADALTVPAWQIAENAGADGAVVLERLRAEANPIGFNAVTGRFEDMFVAGIIDPVKVSRSALQHAASIATMVMTTDALVVESEDDEEEGEGEAEE